MVAVAGIITFRYFPKLCPAGVLGLDVAFVIVGFLLSGSICRSIDREEFTYCGFIHTHIRRVSPPLVVTLLTTLTLGSALLQDHDMRALAQTSAWSSAFATNIGLQFFIEGCPGCDVARPINAYDLHSSPTSFCGGWEFPANTSEPVLCQVAANTPLRSGHCRQFVANALQ